MLSNVIFIFLPDGFCSVSGPEDKYRLRVSGYSGTAGDSMRHSHLQMFSTIDQDNDQEDCKLTFFTQNWINSGTTTQRWKSNFFYCVPFLFNISMLYYTALARYTIILLYFYTAKIIGFAI